MRKIPLVLLSASLLPGFSGAEARSESVQTVTWYKEHKTERQAMLAKCKDNPGELAMTPNCVNASSAESSLTWSARGGIKVKPLTAEDLKKKQTK